MLFRKDKEDMLHAPFLGKKPKSTFWHDWSLGISSPERLSFLLLFIFIFFFFVSLIFGFWS